MIKFDHFAERGPLRRVRQALNDMREEIKSLRIANGIGYTVKRTAIGQVLQVHATGKAPVPSDVEIKRFQVTEVKPTYLECYETTRDGLGFVSTTVVKVLRPYSTRVTDTTAAFGTWTAASLDATRGLTRTLSLQEPSLGLTYTWSQSIYPTYTYSTSIGEGCWIFGVKGIKGFSATDGGSPSQAITWLDLNVDARAWTTIATTKVAVCVDGVTKYMHVLGSAVATTG